MRTTDFSKEKAMADRAPGTYATFKTSEGTIICKLFEKDAPDTVKNFIELAEGTKSWSSPSKKGEKLYDGTVFHRVIPEFMIQGGDPEGSGMGGPGYKFADETKGSPHGFQEKGKLAMANAGPNTNGSQFFIIYKDSSAGLGKDYTVIGKITSGIDLVQQVVAGGETDVSGAGDGTPKVQLTFTKLSVAPPVTGSGTLVSPAVTAPAASTPVPSSTPTG
jgi:peptidyl-prolyl cis-trans isomerase A (cyclophilin A)